MGYLGLTTSAIVSIFNEGIEHVSQAQQLIAAENPFFELTKPFFEQRSFAFGLRTGT